MPLAVVFNLVDGFLGATIRQVGAPTRTAHSASPVTRGAGYPVRHYARYAHYATLREVRVVTLTGDLRGGRQFGFMLKGLAEVERDLAAKQITFFLLRSGPVGAVKRPARFP